MDERIRNLKPYPMVELARRKEALRARGVDVLDFGTGDPVEPTAPFIREALRAAVPTVSQYPTVQGALELRQAIAAWAKARFLVDLDPETTILPTRGSKEAIFHLPLVAVDPSEDRRVIVYPVPGYPVMEIGSYYAGAETSPISLSQDNRYLMDPEQIPSAVLDRAAIVWINYPHNPTGTDLPDSLWRAWVAAKEEHGFLLCSDECYTEIYFGRKPRSILEFTQKGVLAFHSLSKRSGMTGYRCGFVAGDPEWIGLYKKSRASFGQALPLPEQEASLVAWQDEAHVEERREIFAKKRDVIRSGLQRLGFSVWDTSSTFYVWVRAPKGENGRSIAEALLEEGVIVSPGDFFGEGNEAWFRMALVPSVADCSEAIERIERIC